MKIVTMDKNIHEQKNGLFILVNVIYPLKVPLQN